MRLRSEAAGSFCACTGAVLGGPKRFPRREPLAGAHRHQDPCAEQADVCDSGGYPKGRQPGLHG
jgi:hypothetical protein